MKTKDDGIKGYEDRPFNIRPLCFWALLSGITVVVCVAAVKTGVWIVILWFMLLIGGLWALRYVKTKDAVLQFWANSKVFFLGTVILCVITALSFSFWTLAWEAAPVPAGSGELVGIAEKYSFNGNEGWIVLSSAGFKEKSLSGQVQVWVRNANADELSKVTIGSRVSVVTALWAAEASEKSINARIKYTANVNGTFTVMGESDSLRHNIMNSAREFLSRYMDKDNAELVYSMIFGDKSELDGEVRQAFSAAGLAHVLAVSGLHVGLIIGLLSVFFKILRVPKRVSFFIFVAVLGFYCFLCGFNFPVLRASIMFLVIAANRLFFQRTDFLSSLCMAAAILLAVFPYSLLSISFQLSFACMLGIGLFRLPVSNFLRKVMKLPRHRAIGLNLAGKLRYNFVNSVVNGIALYTAVTITTFPLIIKVFGVMPVFGLISNLVLLPVLVICFQASFVAAVTWIAFPVLYLVNFGITFVRVVVDFITGLPFAQVSLESGGYWFLFWFIGIIFCTRFIFAERKLKYTAAALFMAVYIVSILV